MTRDRLEALAAILDEYAGAITAHVAALDRVAKKLDGARTVPSPSTAAADEAR